MSLNCGWFLVFLLLHCGGIYLKAGKRHPCSYLQSSQRVLRFPQQRTSSVVCQKYFVINWTPLFNNVYWEPPFFPPESPRHLHPCLEKYSRGEMHAGLVLLGFALLHLTNLAFFKSWRFVATLRWASLAIGIIFPAAFAHFMSLCPILVILPIFQSSPSLLYWLWWSVSSDLWCRLCNCLGKPQTPPT